MARVRVPRSAVPPAEPDGKCSKLGTLWVIDSPGCPAVFPAAAAPQAEAAVPAWLREAAGFAGCSSQWEDVACCGLMSD